MHDPVSDCLTRIRNAAQAGHETVRIPHSVLKEKMAALMVAAGYLQGMKVEEGLPKWLVVSLRYKGRKVPMMRGIERVSRPGRRVYRGYADFTPVFGGMGISIVSTPRGVMTDAQARSLKVGGEVLCRIW